MTLPKVLTLAAVAATVILAIVVLTGHRSAAEADDLLAWGLIAMAVGLVAAGVVEP